MPYRPRILATVRHPGPAHCLAAAIAAVPEGEWHVAAHPVAAQVLVDAHPRAVARAIHVGVPFDEVAEDDTAGLRAGLGFCTRLFDDVRPDVVIRTTPSTGWGPDELIATAVAGRVSVIGVQDFPGLGTALRAGSHPAVERGADTVLAPDEVATGWLRTCAGVPADSIGWLAHDRFHTAPPYDEQRAIGRQSAGFSAGQICVLVIGSGPDVAFTEEADLVAEAAGIVGALSPAVARIGYRPHPRRAAGDAALLQDALAAHVPVTARILPRDLAPGLAGLAMADVVVSRASVMNLELEAYAATWTSRHVPLSAYLMDEDQFFIAGYWGPQAPATHRPGGGSLVVSAGLGSAVARELATHRPQTHCGRARTYVSDPHRTRAVLRPILLGESG